MLTAHYWISGLLECQSTVDRGRGGACICKSYIHPWINLIFLPIYHYDVHHGSHMSSLVGQRHPGLGMTCGTESYFSNFVLVLQWRTYPNCFAACSITLDNCGTIFDFAQGDLPCAAHMNTGWLFGSKAHWMAASIYSWHSRGWRVSRTAPGCVTRHTRHASVTHFRPISGNIVEVTRVTSPKHVYNSHAKETYFP